MPPLDLARGARVTFLTGAGVSVASGIRPFRGPGGLWNEVGVSAWATAAAMAADPHRCFRAHHEIALAVAAAEPNAAHRSIAAFARSRPPGSVTVITQNIDSLHQRAGSTDVVEIHGSLARMRCTDEGCGAAAAPPSAAPPSAAPPSAAPPSAAPPSAAPPEGRAPPSAAPPEGRAPPCPRCGAPLRYDIVLFDEYLAPRDERAAKEALRACDVFIAAGTSGVVFPAAAYVRESEYAGARTLLVNLEPPSPPNPYFHEVHLGRAEELLPALLGVDG